MNERIEVFAKSETLSDGSKVWNVIIEDEDGPRIEVECVSEAGAFRTVNRLKDIFSEGGAA